MKNILLTFILLSLPAITVLSQESIIADPQTFVRYGTPDDTDIEYIIHINNPTDQTIQLLWGKRYTSGPDIWWSWICDPNKCYLPEVTSCPDDLPNPIPPGDTIEISMHINPRNVEGIGFLTMTLLDLDGNVFDTIVGEYVVSLTATNGPGLLVQPQLFPNPVVDYFRISYPDAFSTVELIDVTGATVRSFGYAESNSYYVGDVQRGIFFVRVTDQAGAVSKLQRLIIQ